MSVGKRIRLKRTEKGMTLEALSRRVGLSRQTLSRYETGVIVNIPPDKVGLIAAELDTTPVYIMGWGEAPEDKAPSADMPARNPGLFDINNEDLSVIEIAIFSIIRTLGDEDKTELLRHVSKMREKSGRSYL